MNQMTFGCPVISETDFAPDNRVRALAAYLGIDRANVSHAGKIMVLDVPVALLNLTIHGINVIGIAPRQTGASLPGHIRLTIDLQ
jgi:hypothetical protein